jgi:enterochelin esterase family protein
MRFAQLKAKSFGPITLLALAACIPADHAAAQSDPDESLPAIYRSVPATSNVPSADYPRLYADGRATFRLRFPSAKSVQLNGGQGLGRVPFPMTQDADGVWSVMIPPAIVGFHYYWFSVDGVAINDPGSETYFGYGKETSGIEIPDPFFVSTLLVSSPLPAFYDPQDGVHGRIEANWYFSKTTGKWRRCFVYTPPGYQDEAKIKVRYPVLILQHGAGENETGWGKQGRMNFIMDNLINAGKAKPMIVVMDNGYARYAEKPAESAGAEAQAPYLRLPTELEAFGPVVLHDLIPMIDSTYRTIPDRDHRAMAGLSMGARETMAITLSHLDTFSYIGSFSPPAAAPASPAARDPGSHPMTSYDDAFADAARFNQKVHLLWFGAGTAEVEFNNALRANVDKLRARGIHLVLYESPGTAHEWLTWRRDLNEFAPLLFQR